VSSSSSSLTEELKILETRVTSLKLEYEQYFMGTRPREPVVNRNEVQKVVVRLANTSIKNTADRFKFNSINQRFMTFKRQWDDTLRKIENGSYQRHIFKANLHERNLSTAPPAAAGKPKAGGKQENLYDSYLAAAKSCGQNVSGLTPAKLQAAIKKQEAAVKKKLGVEKVRFRVEVENGKVKLKAAAIRPS
jgi:hypothetical protein